MLISSFVMSKLDCCNVALAALPCSDLDQPQSVICAATHLTIGAQWYDNIIPLLAELHWLRMPRHILYKLCVLAHQCVHWSALTYLKNTICPIYRTLFATQAEEHKHNTQQYTDDKNDDK